MAIDVAVLRAKLRFESEGGNQAAQDAKKVSDAMKGVGESALDAANRTTDAERKITEAMSLVGKAARSSSEEIQSSGFALQDAINGWLGVQEAAQQAEAQLAELGVTQATANQAAEASANAALAASEAVAEYGLRIRELNAEWQELINIRIAARTAQDAEAIAESTKAIDENRRAVEKLRAEQDKQRGIAREEGDRSQLIAGLAEALDAAPRGATERLNEVSKAAAATQKALGGAAKEGGFFSNVLGKFNNGAGFTIANLASMAARATGFGAAAIVVVRALTQMVQWVARTGSQMIEAADAMNLFSERTEQVSVSLGKLEGFSGAKLLAFIDNATNRWQSFGNSAEEAQQAASSVAQVANVAQFFNATPGDADQIANQLQRSIEGLNFDRLRDLGFDVGRINESFRTLAEDGISLASQRQAAWNEIMRQTTSRQQEATDQLERERGTLAGLRNEFQSMISTIGQSAEMQQIVRNLAEQIREALPTIKAFLITIGHGVAVAVQIGIEAIDLFMAGLSGTIRALAGLVDNPITNAFIKQFIPFMRGAQEMVGGADNAAASFRNWADEIDNARNGLSNFDSDLAGINDEIPQFGNGLEDAARQLRDLRAEASQGAGLAGQIQSLGDAFVAMQEDLNPRTAVTALNQFSGLIDTVIEDGISSLDTFRLRAQAAFELGFFNEAELAEANRNFDNMEQILGPIAREAEKVRQEQERLAQAKLSGITGEVSTFRGEVNSAEDAVVSLANSILAMDGLQARPQIIVETQFVEGDSKYDQIRRGLSDRGSTATFGANFSRQGGSGGPPTPERDPVGPHAGNLAASETERLKTAVGGDPNASTQIDRGALFDQGMFGRGGRGGGGGANSALATIEQLREFFTEVNRAIAIAANGGVRIGTAGNAIPFDEGTFLNSKGGGLSVDTILIRGVWDFADPAAKRQIIRELKEALAGLEAEV